MFKGLRRILGNRHWLSWWAPEGEAPICYDDDDAAASPRDKNVAIPYAKESLQKNIPKQDLGYFIRIRDEKLTYPKPRKCRLTGE